MGHSNYHFSDRTCSGTLTISKGLFLLVKRRNGWLCSTHTEKNILTFWCDLGVNDSSQKIDLYKYIFFHSRRLASDGLLTSHCDNNNSSWPFCCSSEKSHLEIVEHAKRRTALLLGPWSNILILRNYTQLYTSPRRKSLASEITNWSTKLLYDCD